MKKVIQKEGNNQLYEILMISQGVKGLKQLFLATADIIDLDKDRIVQ